MFTDLKARIQAYASEIGIDKIGFCTAEPFTEAEEPMRRHRAMGWSSGFEHQNIEERIYPEKIFDNPQSIISIALAYPSIMRERPRRVRGESRGRFARASWGEDYHHILRRKLDKLEDFIKSQVPGARCKSMVDTGELPDVLVAERAGLGFIGKNGLLITEEFGSFVYLGEMITDIPFEPDPQVPNGCGDCTRCVNSCPVGALKGDGAMNAQVCLSYQTQTKGYIPEKYRRKIGRVIYGCDICQLACPYNKGKDFHLHPEMEPDPEKTMPKLQPFLSISNREFRETYGDMAGSWRGKKPLQRNAIIVLANLRDRSALPKLLETVEKDPRPMIRGTAAWAVSKIEDRYNPAAISFIQEQLEKETDPETIQEMAQAVDRLKNKAKD